MAVTIELNGDEQRLLKALLKVEAKGIDITKVLKEMEQVGQQAGKTTTRVWEETHTPLENYRAKVAQATKELHQGKIGQEEFGRATKQAQQELDRFSGAGHEAFGQKMLGELTGLVGGALSLAGALKLITGEMERTKELNAAASEAAAKLRPGQQNLADALPGGSKQDKARVQEAALQISGVTGVPVESSQEALQEALRASGGKIDPAIAATLTAEKAKPLNKEGVPGLAGALVRLSRVTHSQDPAANLAFYEQVQKAGGITDENMIRSVVPGMTNLAGEGVSAAESAKLITSLYLTMNEANKPAAAGAALKFAQALRKYQLLKFQPDYAHRLAKLKGDKSIQKGFFGELGSPYPEADIDERSRKELMDLVEHPDSEAARASRGLTPDWSPRAGSARARELQQEFSRQQQDPMFQSQLTTTQADIEKLGDKTGQRADTTRGKLIKALDAEKANVIERWNVLTGFDLQMSGLGFGASIFDSPQQSAERGSQYALEAIGELQAHHRKPLGLSTAEDKKAITHLENIANQIRIMNSKVQRRPAGDVGPGE